MAPGDTRTREGAAGEPLTQEPSRWDEGAPPNIIHCGLHPMRWDLLANYMLTWTCQPQTMPNDLRHAPPPATRASQPNTH
eukprot:6210593-Pleurochrysis_carterae.AAC.1